MVQTKRRRPMRHGGRLYRMAKSPRYAYFARQRFTFSALMAQEK